MLLQGIAQYPLRLGRPPRRVGRFLGIDQGGETVDLRVPVILRLRRRGGQRPHGVVAPPGQHIEHPQPGLQGDVVLARGAGRRCRLHRTDHRGQVRLPIGLRDGNIFFPVSIGRRVRGERDVLPSPFGRGAGGEGGRSCCNTRLSVRRCLLIPARRQSDCQRRRLNRNSHHLVRFVRRAAARAAWQCRLGRKRQMIIRDRNARYVGQWRHVILAVGTTPPTVALSLRERVGVRVARA